MLRASRSVSGIRASSASASSRPPAVDRQLGQRDDRLLVAGLELQRLAEAGLVAGVEERRQLLLALGRQQRRHEPVDLLLG